MEKLRISVTCAILELQEPPTLVAVQNRVLADDDKPNNATKAMLCAIHSAQLRVLLRARCKEAMANALEGDPEATLARLRNESADLLGFIDGNPEVQRLLQAIPPDSHEADSLHNDLDAFRQRLIRSASAGDGLPFREALVNWIRSGEPTREMWAALREWGRAGGGLRAFREVAIPVLNHEGQQGNLRKVMEAMRNLQQADEFVDKDKILRILERCVSANITKPEAGHLRVDGGTIALSLVQETIRERITSDSLHTISIYAADCFSLDVPIEWAGINLMVVTRRMLVHDGISINLSGLSLGTWPGNKTPDQECAPGASGRAGASSGNLCIVASELIGGERLSVMLNGGRGEDGQAGSKGTKGAPGIGATEVEIMEMEFPDEHDRSPNEGTLKKILYLKNWIAPNTKEYAFIDKHGRHVLYSMHEGSSPTSLTIVDGTLGQDGRLGGVGGAGGEGGFAGICHITDFEGNQHYGIGTQMNRGDPGDNGAHGERGPPGDVGISMCCWRSKGKSQVVYTSKELRRLRVSYTTAFFTPAGGRLLPHTANHPFGYQTFVTFEDCLAERPRTNESARTHPDRTSALAQSTLQASTAMSEFARMCGENLSCCARSPGADELRSANNIERVNMIRERSEGAEEIYGEESSTEDERPTRPSLLRCDRGLWQRCTPMLRLLSRGGDTFEAQFDNAQSTFLRTNADLIVFLRTFTQERPSPDECFQVISTTLSQQELFPSRICLVRSSLKSDEYGSFIRLLSALIGEDATSPCASKWHFILDIIYALLTGSPVCKWEIIALVMAYTSPDDLVDALIHLCLIVATRKLDILNPVMLKPVRALQSIEVKYLLLMTIQKASTTLITSDSVKDVLLLLRHSARQLRQLSTLSFTEWVETARRRNLVDMEQFGPAAYYLGVLARAGFVSEERAMRAVLLEWKRTHRLFGRFVQCIVSNEIVADESFCARLLDAGRRQDEDGVFSLLSYSERSLEDVANLVRGLMDTDEESVRIRQEQSRSIVQLINEQPPVSENAKLLALFDDALEATTGKRLRPVQKFVVMYSLESPRHLLQQVSTGEGKSFIIAAIAAIRAMRDPTIYVDVISSSSVLAERDATLLRKLYDTLHLSVAHNCYESREEREKAYKARVVYGDIAHFQRDYLLHTFYRKNIRGSRTLDDVIIDEVDSMTIDGGNHVLYLSHNLPSLELLDSLFAFIQREVYYRVDEEQETDAIRERALRDIFGRISKEEIKEIDATHAEEIFEALITAAVIDREGFILNNKPSDLAQMLTFEDNSSTVPVIMDAFRMETEREIEMRLPSHLHDFVRLHISTFIDNCKRARVMRPNVDYVVGVNPAGDGSGEATVTIIDGDTGADLMSTQWTGGLHQFLEMKHACRVTPMTLKAVFISNVTFLRKYKHIDGLSGTLGSAEESKTLSELYGVDMIRMPTHAPRQMVEYVPSLSESKSDWIEAVYAGVSGEVAKSRSALVICETIEQLHVLHEGLIKCQASMSLADNDNDATRRQHAMMKDALDSITVYTRNYEEFEYEERGLEPGRIILSTNLAGRGTDILVSDGLRNNGGLHVVIAFVPRNKRMEEQAMGRAARCGAQGSAQIITLVRVSPGDVAPSLLDFQDRRDQAEKVRIKALLHHFEFRIAVEEGMLEKFRNAVDDNLFHDMNTAERLPEANDIIYKAILDEWTLWLDAKEDEIKRCADQQDQSQKQLIINSVMEFLTSHQVEKTHLPNAIAKKVEEVFALIRDGDSDFDNHLEMLDNITSSPPLDSAIPSWLNPYLTSARDHIHRLCNSDAMANIGSAVNGILASLPGEEVFVVPEWLRAGEWLLRLGIIQSSHAGGQSDAERTFMRLIEADDPCAPYALFYLACMSMKRFEDMRDKQTSLLLSSLSAFKPDVNRAIALFARTRVAFLEQLERRAVDVRAIQQRADVQSSDCGLQVQLRELQTAIGHIIANIDWLIGEPMLTPAPFDLLTESEAHQTQLYESLISIDAISAPAIDDGPNVSIHQRIISRKFGLNKAQTARALKLDERTDQDSHADDDSSVSRSKMITSHSLSERCTLPTRFDFWVDMHAIGAFYDIQHVYVIVEESRASAESSITTLRPSVSDVDMCRSSILYSNRNLRDVSYYFKREIDELISSGTNETIEAEVQALLESKRMRIDILARIHMGRLHASRLLQFDGFTPMQLKEHFHFDEITCNWVLLRLSAHRIIEMHRVATVQLNEDWRQRAATFNWNSSEITIDAQELEVLESLEQALTISPAVLRHVFNKLSDHQSSEQLAQELSDALVEARVLCRRDHFVYRKCDHPIRLDSSVLPSMLVEPIARFLAHNFAYTFAREALASACADAPFTTKVVMLPEDAHKELFDEMCRLEIISPPRIASDHHELIDDTDFPFVGKRELEQFIHSRRLKLRDEIQMFALVPFAHVLTKIGVASSMEMEALIGIGMAAGVSLRKVSFTQKVAGEILRGGKFVVNNGLLLIKGIFGAIRKALGAVAHVASIVISPVVNLVGRVVPQKFKQKYKFASATIDALDSCQRKTMRYISEFVRSTITNISDRTPTMLQNAFENIAGKVAEYTHQFLSFMYEKCQALFGSAEYYNQCRMAAHLTSSRARPGDSLSEHRLVRLFNTLVAAADEQNRAIDAREKALIDQIRRTARNMRERILCRLAPPTDLSFPGLVTFANSLETKRWFETELELRLRFIAIEAIRELTESGRVDTVECLDMTHVTAAYKAMLNDLVDEWRQWTAEGRAEGTVENQEDACLENFVKDMVDLRIQEIFTNPLMKVYRLIISEYFSSEVSQPHKTLLDDDIAMAARLLSKGNSKSWLDPLFRKDLNLKIHQRIANLSNELTDNVPGNREQARCVVDLVHVCELHHRPVPFGPFLAVLCIFMCLTICIRTIRLSTNRKSLQHSPARRIRPASYHRERCNAMPDMDDF